MKPKRPVIAGKPIPLDTVELNLNDPKPGKALTELPDLSALTKLEVLSLSGHKLTSLAGIETAPRLRRIDLSENPLKDFAALAKLPRLTRLTIDDVPLRALAAIPDLALDLLSVQRCGLKTLDSIERFAALESLYLDGNALRSCKKLGALRGLVQLTLSDNPLEDFDDVPATSTLVDLRAHRCRITSLAGVAELIRLKYLRMTDNPLTNLADLPPLPCLTDLSLSKCPLSRLERLEVLPLLEELSIEGKGVKSMSPATAAWFKKRGDKLALWTHYTRGAQPIPPFLAKLVVS